MITLKTYKGYTGEVVALDAETGYFHGRVLGTRDVLTFEATDGAELQREFQATVDDYLTWAAEDGFTPEKPATGTFQVRTDPAIHRALLDEAKATGTKLNTVVNSYLSEVRRQENSATPASGEVCTFAHGSTWPAMQRPQAVWPGPMPLVPPEAIKTRHVGK